jgi:hypothetical protein
MTIIYLWSKHNSQVIVNFMFGIKFPAMYLPLVLGLMDFVMAGDLYGPLVGILVGHAYYFLSEIYVRKDPRWRTRLQAPGWLKGMVPKHQPLGASQGFQGFSVQRPEQSFGGRANAGTAPEAPPGFKAFAGKSQKLGQ